jgi:hypothetical protein
MWNWEWRMVSTGRSLGVRHAGPRSFPETDCSGSLFTTRLHSARYNQKLPAECHAAGFLSRGLWKILPRSRRSRISKRRKRKRKKGAMHHFFLEGIFNHKGARGQKKVPGTFFGIRPTQTAKQRCSPRPTRHGSLAPGKARREGFLLCRESGFDESPGAGL